MNFIKIVFFFILLVSCSSNDNIEMEKVVFLHHSTGRAILLGNTNNYYYRLTGKGDVKKYFERYNRKNETNYQITAIDFPKEFPYGGRNYPYDYYNIWVKNAGDSSFMQEPTLEMLTKEYDVVVFKHCFPAGFILEDTGLPGIDSEDRRIENYKLQYEALKLKMHSFPDTKFIVWTIPALLKSSTTEQQAQRTYDFYKWVVDQWNEADDNIYLWDIYNYETEGGIYMKEEYAKVYFLNL